MPRDSELTATVIYGERTQSRLQRELLIYDKLRNGERLTPRQVAALTGLSIRSARRLLNRLALERPVTDEAGVWYWLRC